MLETELSSKSKNRKKEYYQNYYQKHSKNL